MPNLPKRSLYGWTVIRNYAAFRRWRRQEFKAPAAIPEFPCLVNRTGEVIEEEQLSELSALLALSKTDLHTFRNNNPEPTNTHGATAKT